jgi:hypothetical protein
VVEVDVCMSSGSDGGGKIRLRYRRPLQPAPLRWRFSHSATATQPQSAACLLASRVCSPCCASEQQVAKQQAAASRCYSALAVACCWLHMHIPHRIFQPIKSADVSIAVLLQ